MNTIKKINPLTRTLEEFINLSNNKHNNLYTYENAIYINTMTKLKITCKIHGDFEQIPKAHLIGQGCKHCAIIRRTNSRKMTQQNFYIYDTEELALTAILQLNVYYNIPPSTPHQKYDQQHTH